MDSLVGYLTTKWMTRLEEERRAPEEPRGNWASNIGHPCLFYLWAQRARWDQAATPDATRLSLFDLGNHYEKYAKAKLRNAGFEIMAEQELMVDEGLNIRGRCDGRLRTDDPEAPEILRSRRGVVCEIKGINTNDWNAINSVIDMVESPKPWVRKWPHQLLFYVHAYRDSMGVFAFVNKLTGEPKFIDVYLEDEDCGVILNDSLARINRVNGYLKLDRQAPAMEFDPMYCNRCDWAHICPTAASITGTGETVKMKSRSFDNTISSVQTNEAAGKTYQSARETIKSTLNDSQVWPENGHTRTVMTDGFILLLEVKGGRKYWTIQTKRGD